MAKTIKIPAGDYCGECVCLKHVKVLSSADRNCYIDVPHCSYYYTFLPTGDGMVLKDIHCPEEGLEVTLYGDKK